MVFVMDRLRALKYNFAHNSLFRNATLLVASTAIMSVLGFGFWLFVARLYTPAEIGIASALIGITTLITNLSMLGMNSGLIRFLPKSNDQSRDINAALALVGVTAMIAGTIYIVAAPFFGGAVADELHSPLWWPVFIILMAINALNSLTDNVFIANRHAEYHTIVYAVFGVIKLILPIFFVAWGALGIFGSYAFAVVISMGMSIIFMRKMIGYSIFHRPNWQLLTMVKKYAFHNYIGTILAALPAQIVPTIIVTKIGAAEAAYFSMAWMIANLLYVIPSAFAQSLLAESSHDDESHTAHLRHAALFMAGIVTPMVIVAVLAAPYVLLIFGHNYASGSTTVFQIMAVTTIFVALNALFMTSFNVKKTTWGLVIAQAVQAVVTIGALQPLMGYGLPGIGMAFLLGNAASSIAYFGLLLKYRRVRPKEM